MTHARCLNNAVGAELDIGVTDFHNQLGRQNWQKERGVAVRGRWELSHKMVGGGILRRQVRVSKQIVYKLEPHSL